MCVCVCAPGETYTNLSRTVTGADKEERQKKKKNSQIYYMIVDRPVFCAVEADLEFWRRRNACRDDNNIIFDFPTRYSRINIIIYI